MRVKCLFPRTQHNTMARIESGPPKLKFSALTVRYLGHFGYVTVRGAASDTSTSATPLRVFQVLLVLQISNSLISMGGFFWGEGAKMLCPPPIFSDFFLKVLKVIVFRVILCNHPKDVHVLWVWSEVALSPNFFSDPSF